MSDAPNWPSSQPPPAAPSPSWTYANATSPSDNGAFDAALRDAGGDDRTEDSRSTDTRRADRRDDEDRRKRRKGGDGDRSATNPPPTAAAARQSSGSPRALQDKKGALDILSGLAQHPAANAPAESPEATGPDFDFTAFQAALEQAAARADAVRPDQTLKILFNDSGGALQSVQITRAADGAISLRLATDADAVPEVSRSLEALRRRLEARGFTLGGLELDTESSPVKVAGSSAG